MVSMIWESREAYHVFLALILFSLASLEFCQKSVSHVKANRRWIWEMQLRTLMQLLYRFRTDSADRMAGRLGGWDECLLAIELERDSVLVWRDNGLFESNGLLPSGLW